MSSSPELAVSSPALSPENDEYSESLEAYDRLVNDTTKRFEAFGHVDAKFKNVQEKLHRYLVQGDALWEDARNAERDSSTKRKTIEKLRGTIGAIRQTALEQKQILDNLNEVTVKASRAFDRLAQATILLSDQSEMIRTAVKERISEMKRLEPGLSSSSSSVEAAREPSSERKKRSGEDDEEARRQRPRDDRDRRQGSSRGRVEQSSRRQESPPRAKSLERARKSHP